MLGITKQKISDIIFNRNGTALSQRNIEQNTEIGFVNVKMLTSYVKSNCASKRESIKMIIDQK